MKLAREFLGDDVIDDLLGPLAGETQGGDLVFKPQLRAAVGPTLLALGGLGFALGLVVYGNNFNSDDFLPEFWLLTILDNIEYLTWLVPAFLPVVNVLTTRYVLGADGLRERKQFLSKEERRVSWEKVTALRHRRTVLDKILRIERVDVIAYGQRGATIHLVGLADGAKLRNHVGRMMRESASVDSLFRSD